MDKLHRRDVRFLWICLALIAAGAGVTALLFRSAFPEASIEFRVNRSQARALAEHHLSAGGRNVAGHRFAGRFGVDENPKVYLERELGLERASALYGREAKIWRWEMRWFRSGVKEEERVAITPLGDLVSFESVRREEAPGPRLSEGQARSVALRFLASRGIEASQIAPIEATPVSRPKRTDWTFVHEKKGIRMAGASLRYATTVSGAELTGFREFVHVPEAWERDYRTLRSKNMAAGQVATFGLVLTFLAMLGVLVSKILRKDVRWRLVGIFAGIAFLLSLLSSLNGLPLTLFDYETESALSSYLTNQLVFMLLEAVAIAALIAVVVAAAEPMYRERFSAQLSLSGMFSRRGLRTKRFFLSVVLGYALTAFFFAYQAVFYVVAARFGAWAPADIPYSDMLNTAFPWATVLLIGFLPAVSEEGISRMFSISFLERMRAGRFVAIVLPALIWGFGHAAYPNQPFYIRGVEVGLAGILIGVLMLRYGVLPLLVWHFTVDAIYTAFLMLRSANAYYIVSGAACALVLLLPLAASGLSALRRGGFEPESGLTNGDEGSAPTPVRVPAPPEEVPPVRPFPAGRLAAGGAAALLLAGSFLLPADPAEPLSRDRTGRARADAVARAFLEANGVSHADSRLARYLGTGFSEDEEARSLEPAESGRLVGFSDAAGRYVVRQSGTKGLRRLVPYLPPAYWVVRFFQPEKKEEWKVLVDAGRGRVAAFLNPKEEEAPAAAAPSADAARRRALACAVALGYPAGEYAVIEVGSRKRPRRTDTTVVLEAKPAGVGEARTRLTAVFHGARLAAFYPTVRVPESFLREDRRRVAAEWILTGLKIVAIGAVVGVAIVLLLRIVRRPEFRWKRILPPLLVLGLLAAVATINAIPSIGRQYQTEQPYSVFRIMVATSLLIGWLAVICAAGVALVLFFAARPGWRRSLRRESLGGALARALVAALALAGLARWGRVLSGGVPALFEADPSLPQALERAVPAFAALWSTVTATFGLAALAAVLALAAPHDLFRRPAGRAAGLLVLLLSLLPTGFRSPGQFAAELASSVVAAAVMAAVAFLYLSDSAAAWVLFGALAFGGRAAAELLWQPAAEDRAAGWAALGLILLAVAALLARIPGRKDAVPAAAPGAASGFP